MTDSQLKAIIGAILMVDQIPGHDLDHIHLLWAILAEQGNTIQSVIRGKQVIKKFSPDLFLLDIMMPDFKTYEVCKALKKSVDICDMLVLSALATVWDKIETYFNQHFITKVFKFEEKIISVTDLIFVYRYNRYLAEQDLKLQQVSESLLSVPLGFYFKTKDTLDFDSKLPINGLDSIFETRVDDDCLKSLKDSLKDHENHCKNIKSKAVFWQFGVQPSIKALKIKQCHSAIAFYKRIFPFAFLPMIIENKKQLINQFKNIICDLSPSLHSPKIFNIQSITLHAARESLSSLQRILEHSSNRIESNVHLNPETHFCLSISSS